jgi:hypothetical protein
MGLAENRGSPGGSIGDAGQVGQGGDKRHCRYDADVKDIGKIHPGVLFVVIIVGLNRMISSPSNLWAQLLVRRGYVFYLVSVDDQKNLSNPLNKMIVCS